MKWGIIRNLFDNFCRTNGIENILQFYDNEMIPDDINMNVINEFRYRNSLRDELERVQGKSLWDEGAIGELKDLMTDENGEVGKVIQIQAGSAALGAYLRNNCGVAVNAYDLENKGNAWMNIITGISSMAVLGNPDVRWVIADNPSDLSDLIDALFMVRQINPNCRMIYIGPKAYEFREFFYVAEECSEFKNIPILKQWDDEEENGIYILK